MTAIMSAIHTSLYNHVRVLPTERTTFITFPFPAREMKRTSVSLEELTEKNAVRMIHTVGEFLDMVSRTVERESESYKERLRLAEDNTRIKNYLELAQLFLFGQTHLSYPLTCNG